VRGGDGTRPHRLALTKVVAFSRRGCGAASGPVSAPVRSRRPPARWLSVSISVCPCKRSVQASQMSGLTCGRRQFAPHGPTGGKRATHAAAPGYEVLCAAALGQQGRLPILRAPCVTAGRGLGKDEVCRDRVCETSARWVDLLRSGAPSTGKRPATSLRVAVGNRQANLLPGAVPSVSEPGLVVCTPGCLPPASCWAFFLGGRTRIRTRRRGRPARSVMSGRL
jgi:hypothetical protein